VAETNDARPDRDSFKSSEVCEIAGVQPYVLRSWEQEFPRLGIARAPGAPRTYRRSDVELALRIKHMVFSEGLTLSGVRRRIDAELTPDVPEPSSGIPVDGRTRERIVAIKDELRALRDLLSTSPRARAAEPPPAQPELDGLSTEPVGTWPAPKVVASGDVKRPGRKRLASRSR
jgi:DNA-binding transcriptional MerR regulator